MAMALNITDTMMTANTAPLTIIYKLKTWAESFGSELPRSLVVVLGWGWSVDGDEVLLVFRVFSPGDVSTPMLGI